VECVEKSRTVKRLSRIVVLATELGMTMGLMAAGLAILGLFLGRWLDSQLGTAPVITLALLIVGALVGQVAIYRLAIESSRRLSPDSAQDSHLAPRVLPRFGLALRVLSWVAVPGLVGLAIGLWVDRALHTRVIATLALTLGGLVLGVLGSLRLVHMVRSAHDKREGEACSEAKRD